MPTLTALSEKLVALLKEKELIITTVESCTGGGMANCITNVSGASEVMLDAFVTYSNDAKIALGVKQGTIDEFGVYSIQTAFDMAHAGIAKSVRASVSVGITGSLSRVDPTNSDSVVGTVYIAVVYGNWSTVEEFKITDATNRVSEKNIVIRRAIECAISTISE